jgi:P27 family predicted phage terminase small subunit
MGEKVENEMRGRHPKPIELQILEGDPRKRGMGKLHQALNNQPKAERGLPPCPQHLRGRARRAWKFLATQLDRMNIAHRPDAMMLEGVCANYAMAVEAELLIATEGAILREPIFSRGKPTGAVRLRKHPALAVANSAWGLFRAFAGELGLSPVSRTRLSIENPDDSGEQLWEILRAPRMRAEGS